MGSGQHGLGLLFLDTGVAERKGELLTATHGKDGVEQASGGEECPRWLGQNTTPETGRQVG